MEPLCKNCKHWTRLELSKKEGSCKSEKFVYNEETPEDGLTYWDAESYYADFKTGERFGCIHFERR